MAPTSIRSAQDVPAEARDVTHLVETFGFRNWTFDWEHPLPDLGRRLQVRDDKHNRPRSKVSEIREAMTRGERLKPIILDKTGLIIDGNTRVEAAQLNRMPFIKTVVIEASYDDGTDDVKHRMLLLGAACNLRTPISIDKNELRNAVVFASKDTDYDATRLAALLGKAEHTIRDILNEEKAIGRLTQLSVPLDVPVNGTGIRAPAFTATVMRALGRVSNRLNHAPFAELARLVCDAGLGAEEVTALAKRLNEARSDEKALELLARERETMQPRIEHYLVTRKSKVAPSGTLRQRLGFVLAYRGDPCRLIETGPACTEHINVIRDSISVLRQVLACMEDQGLT